MRNNRKELHRQLRELAELASAPAIYTSRELAAEVKAERQAIINRLRQLPLAG